MVLALSGIPFSAFWLALGLLFYFRAPVMVQDADSAEDHQVRVTWLRRSDGALAILGAAMILLRVMAVI